MTNRLLPLRDSALLTLAGYLNLLDQIRTQLASLARMIRKTVSSSEEGERWRSLPGISWILAYTILAEIGRSSRFAHWKQLCSYSLLAPRACDSGDEDDQTPQGRHVGHMGRRTLKWAFVEAAHGAIRKSVHFRDIYNRRTNNGTRDKGRGKIAVAHELCRIGFSCCRHQRDYREERPPRPGSTPPPSIDPISTSCEKQSEVQTPASHQEIPMPLKKERKGEPDVKELKQRTTTARTKSKQTSRPGTGGSQHPMVAAAKS